MYRVLLVEDTVDLQGAIVHLLQAHCHITIAGTVAEAKAHLQAGAFDLVLLDVELPDGDGFKVCSFAQEHDNLRSIPVIFLTGRGEADDKVHAFNLGADDYIAKPFNGRELKARVFRTLKREDKKARAGREFKKGDLSFNLDTQRVHITLPNEPASAVALTATEFKLLLYFARHEEHILSRDQIITAVWGEVAMIDRTVDGHISKLRKKVLKSRCQILAVHGAGYRFTSKTTAAQAAG